MEGMVLWGKLLGNDCFCTAENTPVKCQRVVCVCVCVCGWVGERERQEGVAIVLCRNL